MPGQRFRHSKCTEIAFYKTRAYATAFPSLALRSCFALLGEPIGGHRRRQATAVEATESVGGAWGQWPETTIQAAKQGKGPSPTFVVVVVAAVLCYSGTAVTLRPRTHFVWSYYSASVLVYHNSESICTMCSVGTCVAVFVCVIIIIRIYKHDKTYC